MRLHLIGIMATIIALCAVVPAGAQTARDLDELRTIRFSGSINAVAWNQDGSKLAVLYKFGGKMSILGDDGARKLNEFEPGLGSYSGSSLAFTGADDLLTPSIREAPSAASMTEWNPRSGNVVRHIFAIGELVAEPGHRMGYTFATSSNGDLIAAIDVGAFEGASVFDVKSGALITTIKPPATGVRQHFRALAFSPDGRTLAAGSDQGNIYIFDADTGVLISTIAAYPFVSGKQDAFSCSSLAFSPDGARIASGKAKNVNLQHTNLVSADIWDTRTGAHLVSLQGSTVMLNGRPETPQVRSLAWAPAGDRLVIGDDRSMRVWDVSGTRPILISDHQFAFGARSVSFSPHGVLAVATSNTVSIYK